MVERPWGHFEVLRSVAEFELRKVHLRPGARLSLHMHHHRTEHWVIIKGQALVTRGPHRFTMQVNESVFIPRGVPHRLENPSGAEPLEIIEVQVGGQRGAADIEHLDPADEVLGA